MQEARIRDAMSNRIFYICRASKPWVAKDACCLHCPGFGKCVFTLSISYQEKFLRREVKSNEDDIPAIQAQKKICRTCEKERVFQIIPRKI